MTINDIMMRDLLEEERKQQERDAKRTETGNDDGGLPWVRIAIVLWVLAAAACAVFMAGAAWKARDNRRQDDAFNRFLLEGMKEAERKAKAMSNAELLRTERECVPAN